MSSETRNVTYAAVGIFFVALAVLAAPEATAGAASDPNLPNVLIIGDSISIGYTEQVKSELEGQANVMRNDGNAADTVHGLANIEEWLGDTKWEVIHFNWGLHDLKHNGNQVPLETYKENLEKLVERMKQTGATLIFATTTPVPAENTLNRQEADVVAYNAAALEIMERHGVFVNDLHALVLPHQAEWQRPNNVHFKNNRGMAREVAAAIAKALAFGQEEGKNE